MCAIMRSGSGVMCQYPISSRSCLVDEKGEVCGSIGTFIDITQSKKLERQNQQLTRELQRLNSWSL
jgi:hypothetical protein